jgi:hypothetical protein
MKYFIRKYNLESGQSGWYPGSYNDAETALAVAAGCGMGNLFAGVGIWSSAEVE